MSVDYVSQKTTTMDTGEGDADDVSIDNFYHAGVGWWDVTEGADRSLGRRRDIDGDTIVCATMDEEDGNWNWQQFDARFERHPHPKDPRGLAPRVNPSSELHARPLPYVFFQLSPSPTSRIPAASRRG